VSLWQWLTGSAESAPAPQQPQQPQARPPLAALAPPSRSFQPSPTEGPKLSQYPTSIDATRAREGGFGYGEPTSAYIEGTAGRIYGDKRGPLPAEGTAPIPREGISLSDLIDRGFKTPTTQQGLSANQRQVLQDTMTRASLAVNYSPLAALGFNPREITSDVSGRSKFQNQLGGATDPATGRIVVQSSDPEALVHESMHRALLILAKNPKLPAYLRERIDPSNPSHESTVRQFMAAQAGDPETDRIARAQAAQGEQWTPQEIALVNKLAQEQIAKNRPRGPR
jgi:hypothetical protein